MVLLVLSVLSVGQLGDWLGCWFGTNESLDQFRIFSHSTCGAFACFCLFTGHVEDVLFGVLIHVKNECIVHASFAYCTVCTVDHYATKSDQTRVQSQFQRIVGFVPRNYQVYTLVLPTLP